MNPDQTRLKYLFEKYFEKTASAKERVELTMLIGATANKDEIMLLFRDAWEEYEGDGAVISAEKSDEMIQYILGKSSKDNVFSIDLVRKIKWWKIAVVASIIFLLGTGTYYLFFNQSPRQDSPKTNETVYQDVQPGSYKAKLILSDGSNIVLDSASLGELARQGNTSVISKDGQLIYEPQSGSQSVVFNTVATNKGETYSFTLADGSKVWLNSASSIHFPVAFPGKERRIDVTGEVYVKVSRNTAQPFIVSVAGMEVLALGTEFNINAYADENKMTTTLIEGVVKVKKGAENTILRPGQQSQLNGNGQLSITKDVIIEEIIAWKDGFFHFESGDLKTILKQFSRWYDVEVIYEGKIPDDRFFVIMSRKSTLASILKALQASDIKFRIEGKKLVVHTG